MSTVIKKDRLGLYVNAGGWKTRPFYGTCFKEGDVVETHHFGGSTFAGVGLPGKVSFRRSRSNFSFEYWCTSGTLSTEAGTLSTEALQNFSAERLKWYWETCQTADFFAEKHNRSFASSVRRKYLDAYRNKDILDLYEVGQAAGG